MNDNKRIIVVTGSRGFRGNDHARNTIERVLQGGHNAKPFSHLLDGAAYGLDTIAYEWALTHPEILKVRFPVTRDDWNTYGRGAAHRRNAIMVNSGIELAKQTGLPLLVIGFYFKAPSNGTKSTLDKAKAKNVEHVAITIDEYGKVTDFQVTKAVPTNDTLF